MKLTSYCRLALFVGRVAMAPALCGAQDSVRVATDTLARITFRTKWDVHDENVRFRHVADSTGAWSMAKASRIGSKTFQVVDKYGVPILVHPRGLEVQALAPDGDVRGHHVTMGALTGGVLAASAVVVYAFSCNNPHTDGVPCGIVIVTAPPAGIVGAIVGGIAGALMPVRPWQSVTIQRE
jgi:hypothetical protein